MKLPFPKYSLQGRLLALIGISFLLCGLVLLLFFPLMNFTLEGLLDRSIKTMQLSQEREATTIARLLVMEFSTFRDLLKVGPNPEPQLDQGLKNLVWEKVTFNEIIEGVELIQGRADSSGRHVTYLFYRREAPELEPMLGPQKVLKNFQGLEKDLLASIIERQWVDNNLLESINRGPKKEGEMLLRYLPVYVLLPDEGAIFWGVAKIGIDTNRARQLLIFQNEEQNRVRRDIWLEILFSLAIAGILAISLISYWVGATTRPLKDLSAVAQELDAAGSEKFGFWLENLKGVEVGEQAEVAAIRQVLVRLGVTIPHLGRRLTEAADQAAFGRVMNRLLPGLQARLKELQALETNSGADPRRRAELAEALAVTLQDLATVWPEKEADWQGFNPAPAIRASWRLGTAGLPESSRQSLELQPLPQVWGAPRELALALIYLLNFVVDRLGEDGQVALAARTGPDGGLVVQLTASGPVCREQECWELLQPFQVSKETPVSPEPALAAALVARLRGTFAITPRGEGGLSFTLRLPPEAKS